MAVRIQFRRDTAANWTSADPILAQGELGYETDTKKTKIGDGTSLWSALLYYAGNVSAVTATSPLASSGGNTPDISLGTVPITKGGTGQITANAGFNALSPMTTAGDLIYENGTPIAARLGIGSAGQVLTVSGGFPSWASVSSGFSISTITANPSPAVTGTTYLCDTSGAAFSVTLPTPTLNNFIIIKDSTGSFRTNNLTVLRSGSEQIEGIAASRILTSSWSSVTFVANGTNWFML